MAETLCKNISLDVAYYIVSCNKGNYFILIVSTLLFNAKAILTFFNKRLFYGLIKENIMFTIQVILVICSATTLKIYVRINKL